MSNIDKEIKEAKATTAASLNSKPISFSKGENSRNEHTSGSFMHPVYNLNSGNGSFFRKQSVNETGKIKKGYCDLFESEIEFVDYLDKFKPVNLSSLSSSQIINYHRFMEAKIKKALMPIYYNKF